jgi:hypothetical protein
MKARSARVVLASLLFAGVAHADIPLGTGRPPRESAAPVPGEKSSPAAVVESPAPGPAAPPASLRVEATRSGADATPEPPSGTGFIIAGSIFTGIAGANLVASLLCTTDFVADSRRFECLTIQFTIVGVSAALGLPMLIEGASQGAHHGEWLRAHPRVTALSVTPVAGGALLSAIFPTY